MDLYLHSVVRNMVDNVQLYESRVEMIKTQHASEEVQTARSDEASAQSRVLKEKIAKVPLNPCTSSRRDYKYPDLKIKNELGFEVGQFGWCICCRKAAVMVCEETQHPVCSEQCK